MLTPFKSFLIANAWVEYALWTKPDGSRYEETDPAMTPHLQRYYRAVTTHVPSAADLQSAAWHADKHYWSAVFISYLFWSAGAGTQFVYSLRHSAYVNAAKASLGKDPVTHPFQAWPNLAMPAAEGDVVVGYRDGRRLQWGDLPRRFTGHCDLIVDASGSADFTVMGGNVRMSGSGDKGLTVNIRPRNRNAMGCVEHDGVFALIKNHK